MGVRHAHRRAQLLYAIAGTMLVFTDTGSGCAAAPGAVDTGGVDA